MSIATDILERVDEITGELITYKITNTWYDGSPMDDSKLDGFAYRKKGDIYYVRTYNTYDNKIKNINVGNIDNKTFNIPPNKEFEIVDEIENSTIVFNDGSKISPDKNTLKNIDFTVTPKRKHTTEIDPDWFVGTDSEKIEAAYDAANKFVGAAIKINRDYYLDRTVVLEGGSIHIIGNGFPNWFAQSSAGASFDSQDLNYNYNSSRIIIPANVEHGLFFKFNKTPQGFTVGSLWIEGVSFLGENRQSYGIYINGAGAPIRPFTVLKCNFALLKAGIYVDAKNSGLSTSVASANINYNNFQYNDWGVVGEGFSAFMNLDFSNNCAEANIYGALDIYHITDGLPSATGNINITNNMLEAQDLPIRIKAGKTVITIENNYFEGVINPQVIQISGDSRTEVFFGKYFCNEDSKLKLNFSFLMYNITSKVYSKETLVSSAQCLEIKNNGITYQEKGAIISEDFKDLKITDPLVDFTNGIQHQYIGNFGDSSGFLLKNNNPYSTTRFTELENGKKYIVSAVLKDINPKEQPDQRVTIRILNTTAGEYYDGLYETPCLMPSNGNECIVFAIFEHEFDSGYQGINVRIVSNTEIDGIVVSRIGLHEYDGYRIISTEIDTLSYEPIFTECKQGWTYYNTSTDKIRIWKNSGFLDLI